jgi:hypothetical protein
MMTSVGHGIAIELSTDPSPAQRGIACSYQVKIKNGTTIGLDVSHEHQITGSALKFQGRAAINLWPRHNTFVPGNKTVPDTHPLDVPTGSRADEFVRCISVKCSDPILQGKPNLCIQNMPVTVRVQIT